MKIKKTLLLDATVLNNENYKSAINTASKLLQGGNLVAIPTETVYGLAANALDETAVEKIFEAKGRPADNPLIVHVSCFEDIIPMVKDIPKTAHKLAEKFWPGPLTIILKKSDKIPNIVSGGLDTIALRIPANKVSLELLKSCKLPLAAPSANISGSPSPTSSQHVMDDMQGRVEAVLDGGACDIGLESTVISLAGDPVIYRPGKITKEEIESIIGEVKLHNSVTKQLENNDKILSPGMKYKHYSPINPLKIIDSDSAGYINFINDKFKEDKNIIALCFGEDKKYINAQCISYGNDGDDLSQAKNLYNVLRQTDEYKNYTIYARMPKKSGVGLAVFNRLLRASGYDIIKI